MSAVRTLLFETEDQVIAEVERLRKGYRKHGQWSLAQICWHVGLPIEKFLAPPEPMDLAPTPEQSAKKTGFVDFIVANKTAPPGLKDAPPPFIPSPGLNDSEIEKYIANLQKLKDYPHPKVMMGPVGPVTIAEFRECNLFHASHHLSYLEPVTAVRRTDLSFANEDALADEIKRLRRGYAQTGNWSLAQICWHLNITMQARMKPGPFPPNTPEQDARKPIFDQVLATGKLPAQRIDAPEAVLPPNDAGEQAIDEALATIEKLKNFPGPIALHRLFGHMPDAIARKQNLIHCAHHLSYLVPTN